MSKEKVVQDRIAVVGAGPAGSMIAAMLATGGRRVVLFEEKMAWEKPCGGGVTAKALRQYPFLSDGAPRNMIDSCELISPSGVRFELELKPKIAIFSRKTLNGTMLERARAAGAEIVCDRVVRIEECRSRLHDKNEEPTSANIGQIWGTRSNDMRWRLRTHGGEEFEASYVVLAAGARTQFRAQFSRAFRPDDLMVTAGYFIPGSSRRMQIRFLPGLEGYIWTFPRCDHFSAGICAKMNSVSTAELRRRLEEFLAEEGFGHEGSGFYSHVLPTPSPEMLKSARFCGDGWGMVGDTAGFVDAITGEGLYYAFRSAELLARAILDGRPDEYQDAVRADFLPELIHAALLAPRFFLGSFMGAPVIDRMVRLAAGSEVFTRLLADLFAGTQSYVTLRERGYRMLPRVLFGMGWSGLLGEEAGA
jgi:flavin-dependent dehydrogenase